MWRRPLLPLAAIAALGLSAAAQAQEAPASPPAAAAPARPSYSPAQMQNFARATVELQAQGSQDPAAMTRAIQEAGMSVEDYNQMGDAMRADTGLASNLNPYLDQANADRTARIYASRAQQPSTRSAAAPARHATASRSATKHSRSSRHAAAHSRSSRHHATKASSHKASKSAARKATSHKSSKTRKATAPAHETSRRHRS